MSLRRDARGKRPQFYADPVMDQAMSMILVLTEEYSALRDRLDTVERVATTAGLAAAIDAYEPPQDVLELREARRHLGICLPILCQKRELHRRHQG
jgi:hypothetical protein